VIVWWDVGMVDVCGRMMESGERMKEGMMSWKMI